MSDVKQPTGPQEDFYPPPPPGPPPGHSLDQDGLQMHPSHHQQHQQQQHVPDSHSELYDYPPPPTQQQAQPAASGLNQQTPHQPPPPDTDGAPKKSSWGSRLSMFGSKAAAPFNMLANKLGAETFLPSTMDKEVEKASRILKAFCKDGIYTDATAPETVEVPTTTADGKPTTAPAKPKKNRTLLTIPSQVISRAVGLAIFTTARAGFHVSGATGSGVLVARLPDGSWSPPSGIQVHSVGAGFMIGIDIYDCVVVINTREALAAFTKTRMSLGSDLAITAGPWGAGGSVDFAAPQGKGKGKAKTEDGQTGPEAAAEGTVKDAEGKPASPPATGEKTGAEAVSTPAASEQQQQQQSTAAPAPSANTSGTPAAQRPAGNQRKASEAIKSVIKQPTYSYVKSRGFYAGVQVDGTIVTERKDANAAFYGEPVAVQQIMHGDVPLVPGNENWVNIVKPLFDTIRGAEGWHGQPQGGAGGNWSGENSPGSPTGYPTGFDPVSDRTDAAPPAKPPRPSSGGAVAGATAGVAAMHLDGSSGAPPTSTTPSTAGKTPAARAKAAEAAAEAEMNREREARERREADVDMVPPPAAAPPGYSEMARPGEVPGTGGVDAEHSATATGAAPPPAYADDSVARPGVGDTKGAPSA